MAYFPEVVEVGDTKMIQENPNLIKFRDWFKAAVDHDSNWRREAREDYQFVAGQQWHKADKAALEEQGRPAITINRIKPQINILSGYQRLNRYDIDFVPRRSDDEQLCDVRKGITKYILDQCDYASVESQVFVDAAICGRGWFEVKYDWDYATLDGEAVIARESPFNIYVDPESRKADYSDAQFIIRARWVDKDELCLVYPDKADLIRAQTDIYDQAEEEYDETALEPLWYQKDTKKLRLVECWYKQRTRKTFWLTASGDLIPKEQFKLDALASGELIRPVTLPYTEVRVEVFFGEVELENIPSPYEHGEFPFVPMWVYNFGENDLPAGIVRDVKDPQREINKRRSQTLHILNTQANSGWIMEDGAMTPDQEDNFKDTAAVPGGVHHVAPGGLSKIKQLQPSAPPAALIQAITEAEQDISAITGINESLLGTDVPASPSGRAIELRQKQAVTHLAPMFDNLRRAKKRIAYLLWGKRNRKGVIPQYYTEAKCYRIMGPNGQPQYINVNQPVMVNDPLKGIITTTLNDLSQGEFDIIISDTPATTSQRIAQFWSLVDAVSKLGIPGDMVFDLLLDLSDIPDKEEIKKRWVQRQQQQAAAATQQQEPPRISEMITFKDAPLPIQLEMAAKAGLVPQQVADAVLQQAISAYLPNMPVQAAQAPPQLPPGILPQGMPTRPPQGMPTRPPQRANTITKPALESLIAGQAPTGM